MKVALICTDNESLSLALRAISAVLKERGHHSRLLFMETGARVFSQAVLQELNSRVQDCDVVGFSCLAQGSTKMKQVLGYLKPQDKITIWGSVHASLNPEEYVKYADYVCLGENVERNRQIVFTSSRGCAFYCTYCCNIKLKNFYVGKEHYVRRMSVSRLIEHSQKLQKLFPNGKYFYFNVNNG